LDSLLPGHIDVKVPFLAKDPKTTQHVCNLSLSNLDEEWSQTCAAHGGMGAIGNEDSCCSFAFTPWQAASLQNSAPSTSLMKKKMARERPKALGGTNEGPRYQGKAGLAAQSAKKTDSGLG